ncbi:MAG: dihydroorotate dehydrogenase electron transfer subunit, partial [Atopobiaceae bacterium]|nr:dihydroorotate dehydrogenase electron transfer subunit [Atopobiaceae bacterium]
VSMERMMGCGFGACACCNVALSKGGYALCCQDGPVFDAGEVAW